MARFEHLKDRKQDYIDFWNKNKEELKSLLEELNNDVFEGKCRIRENIYLSSLETPNICLIIKNVIGEDYIGIGRGIDERGTFGFVVRKVKPFKWYGTGVGKVEYTVVGVAKMLEWIIRTTSI